MTQQPGSLTVQGRLGQEPGFPAPPPPQELHRPCLHGSGCTRKALWLWGTLWLFSNGLSKAQPLSKQVDNRPQQECLCFPATWPCLGQCWVCEEEWRAQGERGGRKWGLRKQACSPLHTPHPGSLEPQLQPSQHAPRLSPPCPALLPGCQT